jgi:hypothetical protein
MVAPLVGGGVWETDGRTASAIAAKQAAMLALRERRNKGGVAVFIDTTLTQEGAIALVQIRRGDNPSVDQQKAVAV